ncbi:hypothetical protein [Streptomyces alkaliterrae]|uniref:Uncharacterized protein n=1 Tax=Streptomyces alkaliterrae TaxID=2213162 RepID=A0A5P0YND7_9ACTN|nr:hypothetical protein [Streptomyces alkaliterrae]MBB1253639.1 hypothetical protein [Streptomyces alkaliterrae]MBB1259763.1 hypothetical protein [Streptomyces alkaliterrae]MQS01863.1 hypothetical protein [Streptomyces alkaliterrae]
MTTVPEEIADQQAEITRLLIQYFHAPLPDGRFVRGVLPSPGDTEAVRVVTSPLPSGTPEQSTVWEIPLRVTPGGEDLFGGDEILSVLRRLHTGTHVLTSSRIGSTMEMTLVRVDPTALDHDYLPPDERERAFTLLRTLTCPWVEEQPSPRLRGYLLHRPDRLRLYFDRDGDADVIAADVRPSGALTALLAALPALLDEDNRLTRDDSDPHCSRRMDLTHW